jgi:hypothetical protein
LTERAKKMGIMTVSSSQAGHLPLKKDADTETLYSIGMQFGQGVRGLGEMR